MSADPSTPIDPSARTGGFVLRNLIYDGTSKGELEVMTHWRATEGTRVVDQYNVPPFKTMMHRQHPCFELNRRLAECADRCDPEMLLAGRCAICYKERQLLQRCLTKLKREDKLGVARVNPTNQSVANMEGTWGAWIRNWLE